MPDKLNCKATNFGLFLSDFLDLDTGTMALKRMPTGATSVDSVGNQLIFIGPIMPFIGYIDPSIKPFICHIKPFIFNRRINAFTLIELMVALSVVAILGLIGAPAMNQFIQSNRLSTATNEIIADLNLARSEAVKRSANVGVCKTNNQSSCTTAGEWLDGWLVFLDKNNDGAWDGGDEVIRAHQNLPNGFTVTFAADLVVFNHQGLVGSGGGDYLLCNTKIQKSRQLNLGPTGRIALSEATC